MLSPKRTKFRKQQRNAGALKGVATRGNAISFGDYGLISLEGKWLTNRQLEAGRIALTRHIKRGGKVWIRVFPDKPFTKKPAETRMGKGKGAVEYWVAPVKPGTVIYEISGVSRDLAFEAMTLAGSKLNVRSRFVGRRELE